MNYYIYATMVLALSVFALVVTAVEAPSRKQKQVNYVLPSVEEMASAPNPLQF